MLDVARAVRSGAALEPALAQVARAISAAMRFETVAIHLYRPAWHDFQVVVVHGNDAARAELHDSTTA